MKQGTCELYAELPGSQGEKGYILGYICSSLGPLSSGEMELFQQQPSIEVMDFTSLGFVASPSWHQNGAGVCWVMLVGRGPSWEKGPCEQRHRGVNHQGGGGAQGGEGQGAGPFLCPS